MLICSAVADDLSCPFNSKGKHPKCICNDDHPYDVVNRICATVLDADYLLAKCPKGRKILKIEKKILFKKKNMVFINISISC